ncbi:MAG: TerB family tellurite resistance protein [Bacteroidia bacterium]|nr:TerB family tellurite resistance protein [Bacteroidia bacterium]MDW8089370.1 TerB family tellurite resistance protein [Bacteroidia bacterium]
MLTSRHFWDGIGGLAYAFVKADTEIDEREMRKFAARIEAAFRHFPTNFPGRSEAIFQLFHNLNYTPEQAYQEALSNFEQVKDEVAYYRQEILRIFREVINADGKVHPHEVTFLTRLEADLNRIVGLS